MDSNAHGSLVEMAGAPQYAVEPPLREVRAHMVQRLQVGLFGLALMVLLVGLANIILQHVQVTSSPTTAPAVSSTGSTGGSTDPLADIGVVPAADGAKRPPATHSASGPAR
ncbi:hypothetical protein GTZ99_09730 [Novosphingobium sp. FSY-8]|uniref:Uncharacterized protein n=1 Tax=Novosphingobium ovatum TaxID=1908523 RepID=A0ABW9XE77_9SPHN|nr:hypothetical protein [Novosphingobium ovatum]NBC36836.1 hypothetical protein [Novosphingobium ovatum]